MRQIRTSKRRPGSGRRQSESVPLPADARDPDIVHAHRVAGRRQSRDHAPARPARGRR
jgi:hypothetical protein